MFAIDYYAVQVYKDRVGIPQSRVTIFDSSVKKTLHFTRVTATGKVKSYSRIKALTSAFGRRA